jgi:two-component system, chemotaxis family, chemotaxis protein CheY
MLEQGNLAASNRFNLTDSGVQPRLLVIEDDTLHRMMICRVAANAGYVPAGAASCDEAAKLMQKDVFDCLTLDLSLGAHDGDEMLRHLAAIGSETHVIIVSGCDDARRQESVALAKSLGLRVWESIAKPVDLVVLRYWLERLKTEYVAAAAVAA